MPTPNKTPERTAEAKARDLYLSDLRKVLAIPEGRRVLWDVLARGGAFRASFTGNATTTAYNLGRREYALSLLNDVLALGPEPYLGLVREHSTPTETVYHG